MKKDGALTLIIQPSPFTYRHRIRLINSALNHGLGDDSRLATISKAGRINRVWARLLHIYFAEAGSYVERILKGTKPADLPVQEPTKFAFLINLKIAKSLGLRFHHAAHPSRSGDRVDMGECACNSLHCVRRLMALRVARS